MKRPRMALSLVLGAMAALVLVDGFPPAERGVAADFSQNAVDPLCPTDFPRVCRNFEWFERAEAPLPATPPSLSIEEDQAAVIQMVEQAQRVTALYALLMDNFSWTAEALDAEPEMFVDFNYGAPELDADLELTLSQPITGSPIDDIALDWRGMPALNWLNECDVCPSYAVPQSTKVTTGDLSPLMATVRCENYDYAAELNELNQGIEPNEAEIAAHHELSESDLALFAPDFYCDECLDQSLEVAESAPVDSGPAFESFSWNGWPLPGSWMGQPSEADYAAQASREALADREHPRRGDTAWYAKQGQPAKSKPSTGPVTPANDASTLEWSSNLADALARMANLLNACSQEMEDTTERIARESAERGRRSAANETEQRPERRASKLREPTYLEL